MNITFHKATFDEISILVDYRIRFALELTGEQPEDKIEALKIQMKNFFSKAIAENTCISFIAKCDDNVAGIGSVHFREMPGNFKNPSGKWGYIMNMYTLPEYRRKGVCKGILNALVEEGKKKWNYRFELARNKKGGMGL